MGSVEAARRRLRDLLRRGDKLGLDVATLPSARRLCEGREGPTTFLTVTAVALTVVALVALALSQCYATSAAQPEPWWQQQQQQQQRLCTINMPETLARLFRPPEDCAMCKSLRQVDRVANISPANFQKRYTFSGHPVVVTDAMRNWTAQHVFDFRFLKTLYQQLPPQQQGCQLVATSSGLASLGEVFNGSHTPQPEPWHIGWRNCDERAAAILRQHYGRPYFLPSTSTSTSDRGKLEWIYLGSPGYRDQLHIETTHKKPSWRAQLKGSTRWFLHPPPECYYQCTSLEVTVQPGEIIVVDAARWYRESAVVSQELSVALGAQFDFT